MKKASFKLLNHEEREGHECHKDCAPEGWLPGEDHAIRCPGLHQHIVFGNENPVATPPGSD
ncbi:MAG: hypothetical protein HZA01_17115 [Nitrospinae bacterium]|nr:hypothetical protein [Nitrospinota bacterium]